ncbi:MAG: hypothetical protein M1832_001526 [Thelocarpon impressellum]|nr:MAG: hypothetical protein M1832_001526 [Thelocarpon impressellum]
MHFATSLVTPVLPSPIRAHCCPTSPTLPSPPRSSPASPMAAKSETLSPLPPVDLPLSWTWTCHLCDTTYPLAVTRRCLHDGHRFCSVTPQTPRRRGGERSKPCSSDFDYIGWNDWLHWSRGVNALARPPTMTGGGEAGWDCWAQCQFPSECRWRRRFAKKAEQRRAAAMEDTRAPAHVPAPTSSSPAIPKPLSAHQLAPIAEDDGGGAISPTSPLKQHYALPPSPAPMRDLSAAVIGPFNGQHDTLDAGILPAATPATEGDDVPDWLDLDSDGESESDSAASTSAGEELEEPQEGGYAVVEVAPKGFHVGERLVVGGESALEEDVEAEDEDEDGVRVEGVAF